MLRSVVAVVVLAGVCLGQGVVLPEATGEIMPGSEWTVLRAAELAQVERATDPENEIARAMLLTTVAELRDQNRTEQNVLLHRLGKEANQLQLVQCYSQDTRVTSEELLGESAVEKIRDNVISELSTLELPLTCTGTETSQTWAVPALLLHFEYGGTQPARRMDLHVVPAGNRLQYFETHYLAGDLTAVQATEDVLGTFNGAKEPDGRVSNLLIGGLAGAVAGILTALIRRNRQQRRAMTAGS